MTAHPSTGFPLPLQFLLWGAANSIAGAASVKLPQRAVGTLPSSITILANRLLPSSSAAA